LIMLGTGQPHRSTVHVADVADFFRRVLEHDTARGYYVVGNGLNPTVAELTEAAAVAAGAPGAVPGSDEEARKRLGDYFVEVLLLDQATIAAKARCPGPEYLNRCEVCAERREGRLLMDRPDQLLNTAQGALVAGATSDESPPGEDSDGESDRTGRGHRADSRAGAAREQLC
jgi:hypothetical protein